jgi:FixJ family two-component response regulator
MLDLNRKIYVVDNDLALRSSLAIMLRSVGYDVELFDDGEAFLRAAQGGLISWPMWRPTSIINLSMR